MSLMSEDQLQYINGITSLNLDTTLYTSSFKKVTTACKEHKLVTLAGPKGCGKTFLRIYSLAWKK